MARGQGETSTSQAGHRKGPGQDQPFINNLVSSMSMEELRSFFHILDSISLEVSKSLTVSMVGEADTAVYFTREQSAAGLCFPVSSMVKHFLHVSRAPRALIHPNVLWILMGYSVLNLLYRLYISWVEIFFIYMLKLGTGGRLSMSPHNPKLQFVIGLPDSPKTKAKGVVLVRGPYYEMPDSIGLPFSMN